MHPPTFSLVIFAHHYTSAFCLKGPHRISLIVCLLVVSLQDYLKSYSKDFLDFCIRVVRHKNSHVFSSENNPGLNEKNWPYLDFSLKRLTISSTFTWLLRIMRHCILARLVHCTPPPPTCCTAPEINISPLPDTMSGSWNFVPITRNSCRSSIYDILLKFEILPVIVTSRKRILLVTHEIVPDSDR